MTATGRPPKSTQQKRKRYGTNSPPVMPLAKFMRNLTEICQSKTSSSKVDKPNTTEDNLSEAIAKAFTKDTVKQTFREEILRPIADKVAEHDVQISHLASENKQMRAELEELKQYTRRNALRI